MFDDQANSFKNQPVHVDPNFGGQDKLIENSDQKNIHDPSESKEDYRKIWGVRVKPGVTKWNIAAIFLIEFINILVIDCEMSLKLNLLTNQNYYNLT